MNPFLQFSDIKPTLDSGIWFGKSIQGKFRNALHPVIS